MKTHRFPFALVPLLALAVAVQAGGKTYAPKDLLRRTLERRAVEAAIWGMPIVGTDAMRLGFLRDAGASSNDIVFLSQPADWKLQIPTPNCSSRYVYISISTKDGPIVIDIPAAQGAGLVGSLNDAWQVPQADIGPTGEDRGAGGRYLILPPGYTEEVPSGYFPLRFKTYNGYSFLRAIPATSSPEDVAKAIALVKQTRVYRLAQAGNPPPQRYIDVSGTLINGIAPFDDTFYDSLARMVDEEPVQPKDLVAMGQLRSLGIEKGKRFQPDATTRALLKDAILEARENFIQTMMALPSYYPGRQWTLPGARTGLDTGQTFASDEAYDLDERGRLFFFGCAPAKTLGAATFYLAALKDATAAPLTGGDRYRLHLPPNVPAKQFWAVTVYDLETSALIRDVPRGELNSYDRNVRKNPDDSVDIFFGPSAPAGQETNWIPTVSGKRWVTLFRFYGPETAIFEKSWVLPDIEKVAPAKK